VSRFAVLGDPVAHSKSPAMHAAAYRALGMSHAYEAIRVPSDDLASYVEQVRKGELAGANVTIPHKRRVLELVDRVDAMARLCGAANTLVRAADGAVVAHNTDVEALARLVRNYKAPAGGTAVVLGSGGAARAAIVALTDGARFSRVIVRARSHESVALRQELRDLALRLAAAGAPCAIELTPLGADGEVERIASCVVQTTSAGMAGADPGDAIAAAVDWSSLPSEASAIEVVYAPPDTPFVLAAERAGLVTRGGLEMLVTQGAIAFELWLGVAAPYDAMRSALPFVGAPAHGILP
jgi:shikimate dehydrogenase